MRLYQLDHEEYPEYLADLIPDHIDQIPLDPQDGENVRFDDGILFGIGDDDEGQGISWQNPFENIEDPALLVPGISRSLIADE